MKKFRAYWLGFFESGHTYGSAMSSVDEINAYARGYRLAQRIYWHSPFSK